MRKNKSVEYLQLFSRFHSLPQLSISYFLFFVSSPNGETGEEAKKEYDETSKKRVVA